jgi:hypothetical protein
MIPVWWSRGEVTVTRPVRARCPTARCDRSAHHRDRCQGARVRGVTRRPPALNGLQTCSRGSCAVRLCDGARLALAPIGASFPASTGGVKGRPRAERGSGARCPRSSRTWRITVGQRGGAPLRPLTPDGDAGQNRWPGTGRAGRGERGDPEASLLDGDPDDSGASNVIGPGKVTSPVGPR